MASRAPDQDFLVGSELGHYRITEKIGFWIDLKDGSKNIDSVPVWVGQ